MILAPADVAPIIPANYESEEHIGNLCKEHAKILARYMDSGSFSLDCTKYVIVTFILKDLSSLVPC